MNRHDYRGGDARMVNTSSVYVSRYFTQPGDFDARSRYRQVDSTDTIERMRLIDIRILKTQL